MSFYFMTFLSYCIVLNEWQNDLFTYHTSDSRSKYLKSMEVWCWRRMAEISWTDRVKNEEVLSQGVIERPTCKK